MSTIIFRESKSHGSILKKLESVKIKATNWAVFMINCLALSKNINYLFHRVSIATHKGHVLYLNVLYRYAAMILL